MTIYNKKKKTTFCDTRSKTTEQKKIFNSEATFPLKISSYFSTKNLYQDSHVQLLHSYRMSHQDYNLTTVELATEVRSD
jgi:hypothetical protein